MERVLTPESLMTGTALREVDDFDAVVRQHQPGIFRFILACLHDQDAAEELTQDCLFRAYRARARFRGDASLRTWLMKIAVNAVRNHVTSTRLQFWKRTRRTAIDLAAAEDWLPDRGSSPEVRAQACQQVAAIWTVAAALPLKQRTVFLLRFVEEMELLEIAAATGMREGTVKAHLFRALQSVRVRIEERK